MNRILNFFFRFLKKQKLNNVEYDNHTHQLINNIILQNGKIWSTLLLQKKNIYSINEAEFKVFSQWGDDGIIQYLINYLDIENKTFIEFGVEDYLESNTRFLLMNDNWTGLVMDGSDSHIAKIKNSDFYWKYDLIAKSAFITAENINQLISEEGIYGRIGLMHIDLDGNDYWIWKALSVVEPIIMIVEYNSVFGCERAISIPYKENFTRSSAHFSNLFAGSSIISLCDLAEAKGYSFIGCNSAGNNCYFIKNGYLKDLTPLTAKQGYVESKFRESRDESFKLNFIRSNKRLEIIKGLKVYNTRLNKIENL
jgi:hypothetical protein